MLTTSFINDRPIANAASASDQRSSSVKRSRPGIFFLSIRFSRRRYSFCSVNSRHSKRATVAITGSPAQFNPSSAFPPILGASQHRGFRERREYHHRGCTSVLGAR